ncbi:MAG: hypothetical protein KDA77_14745, partial [Planctomycetaceae bacterium]|nr:hypothetical protein [Planctomycetaceae bacterium]
PVVLAGLILVAMLWALLQIPEPMKRQAIQQMETYLQGVSPFQVMPVFMAPAIPFVIVLYVCAVIYLVNALYHDRRDSSILFWQSMPVSNLATVLSKVVTVCFLAPLFAALACGVLILFSVTAISVLAASYDSVIAGFWSLLGAGLYSILLVYLTSVLGALWLFPTIGWILLFSAYVKSLPYLWTFGAFILLLFMEDLVFGTQFLANWVESRTSNYNYIVFSVGDFFQRLLSYDMLIGVAFGAVLLVGAVNMRRFAD